MSDMNYKTALESNALNRYQVARYISLATTPEEKSVWRDLLNSEAFNKYRADGSVHKHHTKTKKMVVEEPKSSKKKR